MKTLNQMLAECTGDQLDHIARLWGIGNAPAGGSISQQELLARQMQNSIAARFVWEKLAPDERLVLYNFLSLAAPNGMLRGVIFQIMHLPEQRTEAALTSLKNRMLLLESQGKKQGERLKASQTKKEASASNKKDSAVQEVILYSIPSEIARPLQMVGREFFTPQYDRTGMTLQKILSQVSEDELYEIAQLYGIRLNDYFSRSDPRALLVGNLVQPQVPLYALEHFDAATRKVCIWLSEQGGKAILEAVREHTGYDDATLSTLLHTLEQYAIAFDTFSGQERVLFVPKELLKNLKKALPQVNVVSEVISSGLIPLDSAPQIIHSADTLLVYDIAVAIGAMYQQDIEPTKSATVPKRILTKLLPLLHVQPRVAQYGAENFTLDMLYAVAQQLGLVQLSKSSGLDVKQRYEAGPQLKQWARMNSIEQNQRLLEYWLTSHYWADIPGVNYTPIYAYYLDYITPRNGILGYLNKCTPGTWYSVTSLLNTIKAQDPFLIRSRQTSSGLAGYRNTRELMTNWDKCDGEYITGILSSSLHELGIVSLGYQGIESTKSANPDAFMLTDIGASILAIKKSASLLPESKDSRALVVQPSFELLLLQPDFPTLYNLLPFAQINQVGVVSRLTLTRNSVLRGLAAGMNIDQVLQVLGDSGQKEVPQNVAYTLRDWAKLYKEAAISQALLIEVASESLANEICASPKLEGFALRRLGPCAIATGNNVSLQELRRTLDKEGFVVRISGDTNTRQDSSALLPVIYGRHR